MGIALELVAAGGLSIALVVIDVVMPEMSGPALMERLQAHGWTRVVYMSGYPRPQSIDT
jgi:CheY-like chemotaxis protein